MHVKGKINYSKFNLFQSFYLQFLEALIQTAVENISKMTKTEAGVSGKH